MNLVKSPSWLETIYSALSKSPLHYRITREQVTQLNSGRTDITAATEFLQVGVMLFAGDSSFKPHIHKKRAEASEKFLAQEAWVVIEGEVEVTYFDIDKSPLCTRVLRPGDVSITLQGGHGYAARGLDCLVYEFKTGPYRGVEIDKELINGP